VKQLAERSVAATPGDNSVVIIDSDDDGPALQSPKYTSPKTSSEKKNMLERSIPANIIQSLKKIGNEEWRFAYPVKDFRGVLVDELHDDSDAGDHFPVLPRSRNGNIAFLFFTQDGDVVIVPDDGPRDASLPARSPQSFSLSKCASVCTTLNTEAEADSKNEFVLFFAFKPKETFAPLFDSHSALGVDDTKTFSGLGFKLINPVFVDSQTHLKEADSRPNVKRFQEFIRDHFHPSGIKDKTPRIINVTNSLTHVTVGIPRQKPSNLVEDSTELLDYQILEPEKSCSTALGSSSVTPPKPKLVHRVVSVGDFARLDKGECLSDATIDFYSSYLKETEPHKCRGIYFVSSFFFKKLWCQQQKDSKDRTDFTYMHTWNSIDIFTFDMVMFPVNLNYHWTLIVLENPSALLLPKGAGRCRLIYLDSLMNWDEQISTLFEQWIEWMCLRKTSYEGERTKMLNLEGAKQVSFLPFVHSHTPLNTR
jgi:hypothetical protein